MDEAVPSTVESRIQQGIKQLMVIGRRIWVAGAVFVPCLFSCRL
jgi:hypothetical protein